MFDSLRRAINWFVDGLTEAFSAFGKRLRNRKPLRFVTTPSGVACQDADNPAVGLSLRVEQVDGHPVLMPAEKAESIADRDVELVLPESELLIRAMEPLPRQTLPYLDGVVRHHLERTVPWRADDLLYTYASKEDGRQPGRLLVTVAATARSMHADLLTALMRLKLRKLQLVYLGAPQIGDVRIRVDDASIEAARFAHLRRKVAGTLLVIGIAAIGAVGYVDYRWQQASDLQDRIEQNIVAVQKQLAARGDRPGAGREVETLLMRKKQAPVAVLAIDALSSVLPDGTWLDELTIADNHIRVSGISHSVNRLVPLIEGNPIFTNATFFAPIVRLPNNQGDRFFIDAELVSQVRR
jgi:general secretion pathway protein L